MSPGSPRPIRSSERRRQRIRRPPDFELLQVVYVREAHPSLGLVGGEAGTIVEMLEQPYPAYLVEFIDEEGCTRAEAAFTSEQLSVTPPPP
jgi:Domain of unknown function (DUF4926)